MKRFLFPILAIILMASCAKNISVDTDRTIVLSAGVPSAAISQTKSAIISGSIFTASVAGWETSGTLNYAEAVKWSATASITANSTAAEITLSPSQVYNPDNAIKTYMKAWYPGEAPVSGIVSFTNTDGSVDAMITSEVSGSKNDRTGKSLAFAHKTTQIKFMAKAGVGLVTGTTVNSITITGAQLPTGFTLSTGEAVFAVAANLNVTIASPVTITDAADGVPVGEPVMVKPFAGNKVTLNVETNKASYTGIEATIAGDASFVEGKAYTITLTFNQKGIDLTASVADWTTGTGTGTVE